MIDEVWNQALGSLGDPLIAIGTVFDQILLHGGLGSLCATALGGLTRAVDYLAMATCHHQECLEVIVGILLVLTSCHQWLLSGKNSSIPNEQRLSRALIHHHALTRLVVTVMTIEIVPGPNPLEGTKETTKSPDTTTDRDAMGQRMDTTRELDKTTPKHRLPDQEARDLTIALGNEVAPIDREMHSSQHSHHHGQSIRIMDD